MGSSLSIQTKDKRRRSNRLSKPPQHQATSNSPNSCSPTHPSGQALSLPSTPTAWRNPWTGVSVPEVWADPVSPGVQSHSFSSKLLHLETTSPGAKRSCQSTDDPCLPSRTSPTPVSSRRGSLYRRASFNPSTPVEFQPTTLQSNPQSPLIGQPKRSYSVHSSSLKPINDLRRGALDSFASLSHSVVDSRESLPIRRRSLLMRPGVATRKAARITPSSISESYHNDIVSPDPQNLPYRITRPSFPFHEDITFGDFNPVPQLRPPTPSDSGYTHLGALKLGSLRVVNGSASPCPSERTRLGHAGSPAPEAIPDNMESTDLTGKCVSRPTSPAVVETYLNYYQMGDHARFGQVACSLRSDTAPLACGMPVSAQNDIPATMLNIASVSGTREDVDYPNSPFSFEESPTSTAAHGLDAPETEGDGISMCGKEKALVRQPEKDPGRDSSYRSYTKSHRKTDSGYSSATSHRTSIDSHSSLPRSTGAQRVIPGVSSKDLELRDLTISLKSGNLLPVNRHPSLQKTEPRLESPSRPINVSGVRYERPSLQSSNRLRGLSHSTPRNLDRSLSLPLSFARLRSLELRASDPPVPVVPRVNTVPAGKTNRSLRLDHAHECRPIVSHHSPAPPATVYHVSKDVHLGSDLGRYAIDLPIGMHSLHKQCHGSTRAYRRKSEDNSRQDPWASVENRQSRRHSSDVETGWPSSAGHVFLSLPHTEVEMKVASEASRGRTLNRRIAFEHRRAAAQQSLNFREIYA
ncbi:hypothetical protein BJX61DRAFT_388709 [Aspergillus egyptiacus]|nr:hypothetical protein BJX61DRAFT_388709 [Aspergillus egyptiacus]